MKYVIDIDGTICSTEEDGDYTKAFPFMGRINQINKLYDQGDEIIYYTARGMGRGGDNTDLARNEFYMITHMQLHAWGAKFHGLILGKPSGDLYIDDKGVNADEFFGG